MGIIKRVYQSLFLATLISCAQVGVPTGGVVDSTPPEIVEIFPKLGDTQVVTSSIEVTFDEYVTVKNLRGLLLVSPPLNKPVQWSMKGKKVKFFWDEDLKLNTTYVFQFGEAVTDLHEGNSVVNFVHAFSTGSELDTLSLQGMVIDPLTGLPAGNLKVLLHDSTLPLDSIIEGSRPLFVGTTNSKGEFLMKYLKSGDYRVWALDDKNSNYKWDHGESFAIVEEIVSISSQDSLNNTLKIDNTEIIPVKYFVSSKKDSLGLINVVLSEETDLEDVFHTQLENYYSGKEFSAWYNPIETELGEIIWAGNDTLKISEIKESEPIIMKAIEGPEGKTRSYKNTQIRFSRPIENISDTLWSLLQKDSILIDIDSLFIDEQNPFAINIIANFGRGLGQNLLLEPGAVTGLGGMILPDSIEYSWRTFASHELGFLSVKLKSPTHNGWLELLAADGGIVQFDTLEIGDSIIEFNNLSPGSYNLRWRGDLNGNGIWDGISLINWRAPEPVKTMSERIKIKADWGHEVEWQLNR